MTDALLNSSAKQPTFRSPPSNFASCPAVGSISSWEENTVPHPDRSPIFDPFGLVAGMVDALGLGAVINRATQQSPETRMVPAGHAVNALVLTGLGCVNPPLDLVPRFVQD